MCSTIECQILIESPASLKMIYVYFLYPLPRLIDFYISQFFNELIRYTRNCQKKSHSSESVSISLYCAQKKVFA